MPNTRKYDPSKFTAPDVSTVEHAARLCKTGYSPEQVGFHKTCTVVDWVLSPRVSATVPHDAAAASAAAAAASAGGGRGVVAPLDSARRRSTVVRLSVKRGSLTSLGALARAAHLNGFRVDVTGADDAACELFWCCRALDLQTLTRTLTENYAKLQAKTAAALANVPALGSVSPSSGGRTSVGGRGGGGAQHGQPVSGGGRCDVASVLTAIQPSSATRNEREVVDRPRQPTDVAGSGDLVASRDCVPCPFPRRLLLRVGKFPGMFDICAKVRFSQLMNQAADLYPDAFMFWPETFVLPDQWGSVGEAFGGTTKQRRVGGAGPGESGAGARVNGRTAAGKVAGVGGGAGGGNDDNDAVRLERMTSDANRSSDKNAGSHGGGFNIAARGSAAVGRDGGAKRRWFIVKPDKGSQGDGIFLTHSREDLEKKLNKGAFGGVGSGGGGGGGGGGEGTQSAQYGQAVRGGGSGGGGGGGDSYVMQRYLMNPLLIDGVKFDLRLYVLMMGSEGFPVLLSKEGLARFCTEPYSSPSASTLGKVRSYLTNYALNKGSDEFHRSDDVHGGDGSKRSLASLVSELARSGADVDALWTRLERLVDNTTAAMRYAVRDAAAAAGARTEMCFQVLGFDVMLDDRLDPHLLEVNGSPSLAIDAVVPIDAAAAPVAASRGGGGGGGGGGGLEKASTSMLSLCAALDTAPKPCLCKDHPGPHTHELSPVDAQCKTAVLAGTLEIVRRVQVNGAAAGGFSIFSISGGGTGANGAPAAAYGGFRSVREGEGGGAGWWCDRSAEERANAVPSPAAAATATGAATGAAATTAAAAVARLYDRAETVFNRVCVSSADVVTKKQRESSHTRVRRLLSLAKVLGTTDLDLMLLPWKARRQSAGSGFNHFLDLLVTLTARLYPDAPDRAEAVGDVIDTLAAVKM